MSQELLSITLSAAVPLWIMKLQERPWEEIQKRLPQLSQTITEKGDIILFKSKKKGESAAAFNALAEGIAALSFAPGGITIFGQHWETKKRL
jgi:hypothetical protein